MAVNKNFVVKNGLEVNTDLIFADASTGKVGVGSTIPSTQLDVIGGIGASELNVTGVGTIVTINGTTGIVSTVVGHSIQANNLNVSGITSVVDISPVNLYVTGVTTTPSIDVIGTGNMAVGIITNAQGTNLEYSGIGTIVTGIVTHLTAENSKVNGISTVTTGVSTHLIANNLNVGGITSIRSGVVTHLAVNTLNVGGISTIGNFIVTPSSGGIGATVGANVGVITYYGDGANLINTGGGVGIGSTLGVVGYGFTFINFVGTGNTFKVDGTTVDIGISGGGGSGSVSIGSEAPGAPSNGDLWYSTEYGRTFVWFDEDELGIGNTAVWVDAAPFNAGGKFIGKYGDNAYGAIGYTGGTTSQASIYFTGDPNTGLYQPSADHLGVVAGGTASLVVNPNGISVTGIITGNGSGLTGVASTDNIITTTEAKLLGGVRMEGFTTSATMNVTGISTLRGDITLTGSQAGVTSVFWDASADSLIFQDNSYAKFGAGSDFQIYHDGSSNYIKALNSHSTYIDGQGAWIYLQSNAGIQLGDVGSNEVFLKATDNGNVELYCDNTKQFETAYGGVVVTGIHSVGTGATISGTGNAAFAGVCTASSFVGDGSALTGISAGGGGSGDFNTGISSAKQYDVTNSMATAYTASSSSDYRTIVHSIHICNISASEVTISGEMQTDFSFAHTIPVPAGSAVELLKQPKVLGPSETIELQASSGSSLEATIITELKEDTAYWDAQVALSSADTMTDLYTSSSNPSVVQSILLCNNDGTNDVKARVCWTDEGDNIQSYLVYDMIIPADSTVEICETPKYLMTGYKLRAYANQANRLEITASGKQITS